MTDQPTPPALTPISRAALVRKLTPGRLLTMVSFHGQPCDKPRRVIKANARSVTMAKSHGLTDDEPTYLDFRRGDMASLTDDGFVVETDGCRLVYRWDDATVSMATQQEPTP